MNKFNCSEVTPYEKWESEYEENLRRFYELAKDKRIIKIYDKEDLRMLKRRAEAGYDIDSNPYEFYDEYGSRLSFLQAREERYNNYYPDYPVHGFFDLRDYY